MSKLILIICFALLCSLIFAQEGSNIIETGLVKQKKSKTTLEQIDSLKAELFHAKDDTNKVKIYISLSDKFRVINSDESTNHLELGLQLAQKLRWKLGEATIYYSIGTNFNNKSEYKKALEYSNKALKINEELDNKIGISSNLALIGVVYKRQSDYTKALEYYLKALNIDLELENKSGIASNYNNIGNVYKFHSDFPKALEYFQNAQKINEEIGNKAGIAANLVNIAIIYSIQSDFPKALECFEKALLINEELGDKLSIAGALGNIGTVQRIQSDYPKALRNFEKALKIEEELGNKSGMASSLGSLGVIYLSQSNYSKALEYSFKSLKISEEIEDKMGIANSLSCIGNVYSRQNHITKALEYYQKALLIIRELNDKYSLALVLGNIGTEHIKLKEYQKAIEHFQSALKINEALNNKYWIANDLLNIGVVYFKQSDYTKALEYFTKSLEINKELGVQSGIGINLGNIGEIYLTQSRDSVIDISPNKKELLFKRDSNINMAIDYSQKAINMFIEIGELSEQSGPLKNLSEAYSLKGEYKKAFEIFKEFKKNQDSVFSMEKQKEFANLEAKRENELKDKEIEIQTKENEILKQQSYGQTLELDKRNKEVALLSANQQVQNLELEKRKTELNILQKDKELAELSIKAKESEARNKEKEIELLQANEQRQRIEIEQAAYQQYALIAGLLLFALFIIIIFVRFREKKKLSDKLALQNAEIEKQKSIVEEQKEILQEKNTEIIDSINYAATIQHAILPWKSTLKNAFNDILIYYKPKDIVSGDLYWFQEVDGVKFLAVIDCTGHGVPGSMLTVIANSVLDDAVLSKKLTLTSDILTYMNEKVTEVLNQRLTENNIRDGMEVVLIAIHEDKIQFSGAGRPLYVKNGTFETLKTDKRGIAGQNDNDTYNFSSLEIEKTDNLMLYLTSDGFADQMNENSKKFASKRFVETLERISTMPLNQQKEILENEFNSHKGNREQIDDVTVIGVRI